MNWRAAKEAWDAQNRDNPWRFPRSMEKAMGVSALVGALLFVVFFDYHFIFLKVWMGLAFGLVLGAFGSLAWFLIRDGEPPAPWRRLARPLLLAGLMGVFAVWTLWRSVDENRRVAQLRSLDAESITEIVVSTELGERVLVTIEDRETIREFVRACQDTRGYSPSHPGYTQTWLLRVISDEVVELQCSFVEAKPEAVLVGFVTTKGAGVWHHGDAISRNLRPWFDEYVVGAGGE